MLILIWGVFLMNISKQNSPNKYNGRNGWKPDMIVCHITEGSYSGAVSWLCNPASEASAHFVISKDGKVTQLVDLRDSAWCNGTSINSAKNTYYGKSSIDAVRKRTTNANYYTISIEHEGVYRETHGKLTDAQKTATIELIKYIRSEVKGIFGVDIPADRKHIVGHYQINPITKPHCPGEEFPFDEIIAALNTGSSSIPINFEVGDVVRVKTTATNYTTGQDIASFVKGANYKIKQINNSNKSLLLEGINSWVNMSDVIKIGSSSPVPQPKPTPPTTNNFSIGQKVKVKTSAAKYATDQNIANFVKGNTYTITQLKSDRALLSDIISWVYLTDLEAVRSTPDLILKVGSKVKIIGSKYATGQTIPQWVKNAIHVVSQISAGKVLLDANGGINSWVNNSDITVIG